jgi:gamma-glutamyl:cysteine ligase YbdK (ATP-grasp superfamily)
MARRLDDRGALGLRTGDWEAQVRTLALARHKQARAVELLLEGRSYEDIARLVGYTHRGSAHRAVRQALHAREVAAIDQLRAQEVERLDALQAVLWPLAEAGNTRATAAVLRIIEQRVPILGLEDHSSASDTDAMTLVPAKATQDEQPLSAAS